MTIAIVTDSTSDLSPQLLTQYGIHSVPLYVNFDGQMYKDGQISPDELFAGVRAGKKTPSTSQPSPAEFAECYRQVLCEADQIISIHLSGQLSGTVGSAQLAAQEFGGQVTVLDSKSITMGLGLRAIRAAQRVQAGKSVPEIVSELEMIASKTAIRFTVDTLEFLRLNGRIGGAQALLGSLLNIKPVLALSAGRVESAGRVRGHKKAIQELVQYGQQYIQEHGESNVAFLYTTGGEEGVAELRAALSGLTGHDHGAYPLGAVIATHTGPGTVGLVLDPVKV